MGLRIISRSFGSKKIRGEGILKAAGTPMIKPLLLSSLERSILVPGVFSYNSMEGIESPTLTILAVVGWNEREAEKGSADG